MEKTIDQSQIKLSTAGQKLVLFLKQKYKDVIKFDAAKQFFEQASTESINTPEINKGIGKQD